MPRANTIHTMSAADPSAAAIHAEEARLAPRVGAALGLCGDDNCVADAGATPREHNVYCAVHQTWLREEHARINREYLDAVVLEPARATELRAKFLGRWEAIKAGRAA